MSTRLRRAWSRHAIVIAYAAAVLPLDFYVAVRVAW